MKIYVGSDHAGFGLKEKIKPILTELGHDVEDKGPFEYNEEDDYPDYIIPVAREVSQRPNDVRGIVFGLSGQGEAMTANKFSGVRATTYYGNKECVVQDESVSIIVLSRQHNDANVLSIGSRFVTFEEASEAIRLWLSTEFSNSERHVRRITKMNQIHE